MTWVLAGLDAGRGGQLGEGSQEQRRARDGRGTPAEAEEHERERHGDRGVLSEEGQDERRCQQSLTEQDRRHAPPSVGEDAEHGREGVHPGDVQADRDTDDGEGGAVVQQVHGCHGHHRHHHTVRRCDFVRNMSQRDANRAPITWAKLLETNRLQPDDRRVNERTLRDWRRYEILKPQIEGEDMVKAIQALVGEENAKTIKDMGRTMSALKEKYAGRMDFAKASGVVKELLV